MSGSLSEQNALIRSQRVRTNMGLPPLDTRTEDTPRRRNSSSREPEDRTVIAATDMNNRGMRPVSEDSEDEGSPLTVRSLGMKPRESMQELDPPIGEITIISTQEKSAIERLVMIQQKTYLRDLDPITLKMRYQLWEIQFPRLEKGRLGQQWMWVNLVLQQLMMRHLPNRQPNEDWR